ncbi:MAG TPA: hypothetical protein VGI05_10470 [Streptosporangiaceae bacterium]
MRRPVTRSCLIALTALATAGALFPGAAQAAGARTATVTKWTKISTDTSIAIASAGLFRTADGMLHVAWPRHDTGSFSLNYSTVGPNAKLEATGTIVQGWNAVSAYPRLAAGPSGGIRAVFTGGNGVSGSPYNRGTVYSATSSSAGTSWALVKGSMSQSTFISLTDTSATTQSTGTPVASWPGGSGVAFHVGTDPNTPATKPDGTVTVTSGSGTVVGTTLARETDGSVWAAWFTESGASDQGYWVDKITPTQAAKTEAPGSGSPSLANNQPFQSVAFAAGAKGGGYLAYCVPTASITCAHIALWKVGAAKATTVPGSTSQHAIRVATAAAPGGHLWVLWYDTSQNKIHVIRSNAAVTKFGPGQTIAAPPSTGELDGLQAEGSQGPLDVVALVLQNVSGSTPSYWDIQLLPKLTLTGSPATVAPGKQVTFTVTDVGDPVAGATVTFLGKNATTNSSGVATFTVPTGTAAGSYQATASMTSYTSAMFTEKVS